MVGLESSIGRAAKNKDSPSVGNTEVLKPRSLNFLVSHVMFMLISECYRASLGMETKSLNSSIVCLTLDFNGTASWAEIAENTRNIDRNSNFFMKVIVNFKKLNLANTFIISVFTQPLL